MFVKCPAVSFRYRLFSRAGEALGTIELALSSLEPGETFTGHGNQQFRVVDVVPFDEGTLTAILTVQPAADVEQPRRQ